MPSMDSLGEGGDTLSRIQTLSKKNRELTATLGGEQARTKKLATRVTELEKQVEHALFNLFILWIVCSECFS